MTLSAEDNPFHRAVSAMQAGKDKLAERLFKEVLQSQPKHVPTLNLLSILLTRSDRFAEAEYYVRLALAENATSDATFYNYGLILKALKRPAEALQRFTDALKINASVAETWNNRGTVFNELKRYREAVADFDRAIALNRNYPDAFFNKGNALADLKSYQPAVAAYDRALALRPDLVDAWLGRGNVLTELKEYDNAFAAYDRVLALKPDLAAAWLGRGNILAATLRYDEALAAYDKALASDPALAKAWLGRGNVLIRGKHYDDARSAYDRALASDPNLAEAWLGCGNVFTDLRQYDKALSAFDRAVALDPDLAGAWLGLGNIHIASKRYGDACTAFDKALASKPDLAEAWFGRGSALEALQQYDQACADYERAIALKPALPGAIGARMSAKLFVCDWTNLEEEIAQLLAALRAGKLASAPGIVLELPSSAADQLQCAKRYVQEQPGFPQIWRGEAYSHDRIRVAYLSGDFREHAVAYLMAGLFEHHDKSRFEITALSFGPEQDSPMRRRIEGAVEHFVDVRPHSEQDIAELIRRREIDIAVDLMGFTGGNRLDVLARRPAPVQVNYLGYSGTMGADYIDYILADATVIPEDQCGFYSERVIWLPDCYLVNDDRRVVSERTPSRRECGLPEDAFVFCCFNNSFKLAPETFEIWMRLLEATRGSVLWLSELNSTARANLGREAERRGVSAQRLIFAPRVPQAADHLARQCLADLFLDTLPYNAHTTACDALWAGVPVLTCLGETFAGRVAGSLLKAVGLDELIAASPQDYEALAVKLAHEPSYLASIKERLARNRTSFPLFDTERSTRKIEAAYTMMWQRYQSGEMARPRSGDCEPLRVV